jgi:hypothetical protein
VEVNVFFLLSFDVWKEEGKGMIIFFLIFFLIVDWLGTGGEGFFLIC